jgi:DNA replication protein DnaC
VAEFDGLLILDDVGTEKDSEWATEQITGTTGWRYRHRLPTLMTTNLVSERFRARYTRLYSRCHEGVVIPWWAPDWRRR